MTRLTVYLPLLLFLCMSGVGLASVEDSWTDYLQDKLLTVLDKTQRYRRDVKEDEKKDEKKEKLPPNALINFEDCGQPDDPILVNFVTVDPNPVIFPGDMKITFSMTVKKNKTSPIKAEMTMSKKISLLFGLESWFDIPCLDNKIGSCTFDDLCENEVIKEGLCRLNLDTQVEECGCPFVEGNYTSKPVNYNVPAFPEDLPSYLLRGEFTVKALITKDEEQLACYMASFFLEV